MTKTKLQKLREAWTGGDFIGALSIAAKFPRLGVQKEDVERAWAAWQNPAFYRSIGRDPMHTLLIGLQAISIKYNLEAPVNIDKVPEIAQKLQSN